MTVYRIAFEVAGSITHIFVYESEDGVIDSFVNKFADKENVGSDVTLWVCYDEGPDSVLPFIYSEYYTAWRISA